MTKEERIGEILNSLDLSFSDFATGENVREITLEEKIDIIEDVVEILKFEEAINFSIFSSFGAKHPSAEIYAVDFPSDLRASAYLLLGGYYRQAILSLRNWLEIRLTGIYYGFTIQNVQQYEDWKSGKYEAPTGRTLIVRLFQRADFHKKDALLSFRTKLNQLYSELSAFTHGGGLNKYNLQAETDNVPRFNSNSVDLWHQFARRIFQELVLCFFIAYGKNIFCRMGADEIKNVQKFLPETYQKELQL
jgi:hypothetical protein